MRTAYCPESHRELSATSSGAAYGHVPGHQYSDVDVVVSVRDGRFRCHVVQSWGSAQGYDEEHGRAEVVGRGDTVEEACRKASAAALAADISQEHLTQALTRAEDEALESLADAAAAK